VGWSHLQTNTRAEGSQSSLPSGGLSGCPHVVLDRMKTAGLRDYHVHTPLCRHAEGWPVDFAKRAVELGLEELGFADHNPMPEAFDDWRMLREELPRYFASVEEARQLVPGLPIRLGLEMDYLPGQERWWEELKALAPWDYWIGSVHYLPGGWEVDNPKYLGRHRESDPEEIWISYWKTLEKCIRSGWFDFVGHADLPKKFGFRPKGDLRRFYEPAIEAMVDTGVAFEVNTAGLRKDCRELYPASEFLRLAAEAGVPVLINSDAHAVGELGAGFEEALESLLEAGYSSTVRFERGRRIEVPLPAANVFPRADASPTP
jgi:histidinol-phosphatase (PHP family)